jgi:hypothetical protein
MYIDCPNQVSLHLVNLRNHSLGRNLGSSCIEGATLLGVGEVLNLEDLNFSILLDERHDADIIVVARGTVDEGEYGCGLRRGILL